MSIGTRASGRERQFRDAINERRGMRILELGTRRWDPGFSTHHQTWAIFAEWVMSDVADGIDVDVVADAHNLGPFASGSFDAYAACSVYEHLQRPWIAAQAAARVLRPGGRLYVDTHQTFPLHGYPNDYFRFSREALATIFTDAGFEVLDTGYSYPCKIQPPPEVTRWNTADDVEAWLNVDIVARLPE